MGEIENIQYLIPLEIYERKVTLLIESLLEIDQYMTENQKLPKEVA